MQKKIWFYVHWFLGIFAGSVLIIVGVTGAMLSFEKEILEMINKQSLRVEVREQERLAPDALIKAFLIEQPNASVSALSLFTDPQASATISVGGEGGGRHMMVYYINPYTGELLPQLKGGQFFRSILDLHRRLMLGDVGKQLVGASTIALIVLSFSGIYLYWGSIRRNLKKSLSINFKAKGRGFLYKLHSASALWMLPLLMLISLTGLFWSYEWYRASLYSIAGVEMPKRTMHHSQKKAQKRGERIAEAKKGVTHPRSFEEITHAWALFETVLNKPYAYATVRIPTSGSTYTFNYMDENAPHSLARNVLTLETKEAKVLSHTRYDDKRMNEQIMSSILPLHSGEFFGLVGRILVFLASVGMLLFGMTGLMLYLDRRKKEQKKALKRNK